MQWPGVGELPRERRNAEAEEQAPLKHNRPPLSKPGSEQDQSDLPGRVDSPGIPGRMGPRAAWERWP
jgi:hypothetical protein